MKTQTLFYYLNLQLAGRRSFLFSMVYETIELVKYNQLKNEILHVPDNLKLSRVYNFSIPNPKLADLPNIGQKRKDINNFVNTLLL